MLCEGVEDLVGESPLVFRPTRGGDKAGRLSLHADAQVQMTCNDNQDDNANHDNDSDDNIDENGNDGDNDNNIDDNDDDNSS